MWTFAQNLLWIVFCLWKLVHGECNWAKSTSSNPANLFSAVGACIDNPRSSSQLMCGSTKLSLTTFNNPTCAGSGFTLGSWNINSNVTSPPRVLHVNGTNITVNDTAPPPSLHFSCASRNCNAREYVKISEDCRSFQRTIYAVPNTCLPGNDTDFYIINCTTGNVDGESEANIYVFRDSQCTNMYKSQRLRQNACEKSHVFDSMFRFDACGQANTPSPTSRPSQTPSSNPTKLPTFILSTPFPLKNYSRVTQTPQNTAARDGWNFLTVILLVVLVGVQ